MPESLARKISLFFTPVIFAEGHIMNSSFVAIVPLYALVLLRTLYKSVSVRWFYKVEACIIIHMSLYMLSHIAAWTQGRPLLPALRNSGRFLTIPLRTKKKKKKERERERESEREWNTENLT